MTLTFTNLVETDMSITHAQGIGAAYRQRHQSPQYLQKLHEAQQYLNDLRRGHTRIRLREAMTTSDFPNLFGDILSRRLVAEYMTYTHNWEQIADRRPVPDFRNVKTLNAYGGDQLLTETPEGTVSDYRAIEDQELANYAVKKYDGKVMLTMEALVNDDLGAFDRLPSKLASGARRTEERFVTTLYAGASGPLPSVYSVGNNNIVTGNPPLSISGLQTAFEDIGNQVDEQGLPIVIDMITLVVPPALEITARNILNATELEIGLVGQGADAAPAPEQRLRTMNWMRNRTTLVVNPWLPYLATSNGNTSWYLFGDPRGGRPALEMGFLSMLNGPVIYRRMPDAASLTGGELPIGSFDSHSFEWGVLHVFGGSVVDNRYTVASNGTGS